MKILLNIIATNKYVWFLDKIVPSIDQFFFPNEEVTVLVHTNNTLSPSVYEHKRLKILINEIPHEGWPFITLKRFHYFLKEEKILSDHDYCFYIDADSLFIKEINQSHISESGMFGTIHPCLFNGPGTPERNPNSLAYIPEGSNNRYFCGGFFGGSSEDFVQTSKIIKQNIDTDLSNGIIAVWHDESHLNHFFFHNPPSVVFDNPFAVAENLTQEQNNSHIKFLDKSTIGGHDYFRSS
jgi:histo-blood group ABO system transferase